MGRVNAIVDDIHKLNAEVQKKKIAHRFKFRSLLTDEQKKIHDAHGGLEENVRVIRRKMISGPGGEDMMWFGDGDEDIDMLHDFDIDIEEHEHMAPHPRKKIELKRKL